MPGIDGTWEKVLDSGLTDADNAVVLLGKLDGEPYMIGSALESAGDMAGVWRFRDGTWSQLDPLVDQDFNGFMGENAVEFQGKLYVGDRHHGRLHRLDLTESGDFEALTEVASLGVEDIKLGRVFGARLWAGNFGFPDVGVYKYDGQNVYKPLGFPDARAAAEITSMAVWRQRLWVTLLDSDGSTATNVTEIWAVSAAGTAEKMLTLPGDSVNGFICEWRGDLYVLRADGTLNEAKISRWHDDGLEDLATISVPTAPEAWHGIIGIGNRLRAEHVLQGAYYLENGTLGQEPTGENGTVGGETFGAVNALLYHDGYLYATTSAPIKLWRRPASSDTELEHVVLDPVELAVDRAPLDLHSGALRVRQEGIDWGDAAIQAYMAEAERGQLPVDYRVPNREIHLPMMAMEESAVGLAEAREALQAKAALIQREGGLLKRTLRNGDHYYLELVDATLKVGGGTFQAVRDIDPDVELSLVAVPDFYGAEQARRSHTQEILSGTPVEPDTITNLAGWWKADRSPPVGDPDGPVGLWQDSSGNNRSLSQATSGKTPVFKSNVLNGKPVVRFDGVDDLLQTSAFTLNQTHEILVVGRYRTAYGTGDGPFIDGLSGRCAMGRSSATHVDLYAGDGGNFNVTTTPESWHVYDAKFAGASSQLRIDGGTATTASAGTSNPGGITLGNDPAEDAPGAVDIAEVLVYSRALTTDERNSIGGYLEQKYGIVVAGATIPGGGLRSELVFTEDGIEGDYPARTRIEITNGSVNNQHGLLWGVRSRHYDSASTAALSYKAEAMTPLDTAATTTLAGATSANVVRHNNLATRWTPVLSTQDVVTDDDLTHTGSYRLYARVYTTSGDASTACPQLRVLYGVGDFTVLEENTPWQIPAPNNFYLADLGTVRIDRTTGPHRWRGIIQAKGAVDGQNVYIGLLELQPLDEGSGRIAVSPSLGTGMGDYDARDTFASLGLGAALNGRTVESGGGTWATSAAGAGGSTTDFAGDGGGAVIRSTISDATSGGASGRRALYSATYSAIEVGGDFYTSAYPTSGPFHPAVYARFVDTDNYLKFVLSHGAKWQMHLQVRVAGTTTDLGFVDVVAFPNIWLTISLRVTAAGNITGSVGLQGAQTPLWTLQGYHSALATGGALDDGKFGFEDYNGTTTPADRYFDNVWASAPTPDAVLFGSAAAQLTTEGVFRQDTSATAYGPLAADTELIRLPPSGLEGRPVEIFLKNSRGDFREIPDSATEPLTARVFYSPSWLTVPGS